MDNENQETKISSDNPIHTHTHKQTHTHKHTHTPSLSMSIMWLMLKAKEPHAGPFCLVQVVKMTRSSNTL